jgi:hypothetical protein
MSLKSWADNKWLKEHKTSPQEITDLFGIVDRDLKDAQNKELSADGRFGFGYNAALKLCTILLFASGYRPDKGQSNHYLRYEIK